MTPPSETGPRALTASEYAAHAGHAGRITSAADASQRETARAAAVQAATASAARPGARSPMPSGYQKRRCANGGATRVSPPSCVQAGAPSKPSAGRRGLSLMQVPGFRYARWHTWRLAA